MFAACIEHKNNKCVGQNLIVQAKSTGLAGIAHKSVACWEHSSSQRHYSLVEQSIHQDECVEVVESKGVIIIGWLRIYNQTELCDALNVDSSYSDRELMIAAYLNYGEQFCEHIIGDFSCVVIDLNLQRYILCRDHLGVRPLYYFQHDDLFICASSLAVFLSIKSLVIDVSEEFIVRYCLNVSSDWEKSPYTQIKKIPPANVGIFNLKNHFDVQLIKYFQFDSTARITFHSEQAYIDEYRKLLEQAVKSRTFDCGEVIACESSGGLDSSSIVAIAAKYMCSPETDLYAYGYVTEVEEEECIVSLSDFLGIKNTCLIKDNSHDVNLIEQANDEFVNYSGSPVVAHIAPVHAPIYQRAKENGADVLLSGFGGDEFVTIYGATARVELYKTKQWEEWFSVFKGNYVMKRLRAIKWLCRFYWNQNCFESASALMAGTKLFLSKHVLNQKVCVKYNVENIAIKRSQYDSSCSSVNEFSLSNRHSPELTARLEDCSLAAAAHGIEYRWPLLDVRLIQFFLSVPAQYKLNQGVPRYLHRKSIQGLIPEKLIWKVKDMGGPIVSRKKQMDNVEQKNIYDSHKMIFDHFDSRIQTVLDRKKWLQRTGQLTNLTKKEVQKVPILMACIAPILTLNEWLKWFKTR